MDTYTISPRAGAYRVEATAADGTRRLVGTYPSEQAAVMRLRTLQEKAGVPDPGQRRPQDWRL
jgi:hypothetical protein